VETSSNAMKPCYDIKKSNYYSKMYSITPVISVFDFEIEDIKDINYELKNK